MPFPSLPFSLHLLLCLYLFYLPTTTFHFYCLTLCLPAHTHFCYLPCCCLALPSLHGTYFPCLWDLSHHACSLVIFFFLHYLAFLSTTLPVPNTMPFPTIILPFSPCPSLPLVYGRRRDGSGCPCALELRLLLAVALALPAFLPPSRVLPRSLAPTCLQLHILQLPCCCIPAAALLGYRHFILPASPLQFFLTYHCYLPFVLLTFHLHLLPYTCPQQHTASLPFYLLHSSLRYMDSSLHRASLASCPAHPLVPAATLPFGVLVPFNSALYAWLCVYLVLCLGDLIAPPTAWPSPSTCPLPACTYPAISVATCYHVCV